VQLGGPDPPYGTGRGERLEVPQVPEVDMDAGSQCAPGVGGDRWVSLFAYRDQYALVEAVEGVHVAHLLYGGDEALVALNQVGILRADGP